MVLTHTSVSPSVLHFYVFDFRSRGPPSSSGISSSSCASSTTSSARRLLLVHNWLHNWCYLWQYTAQNCGTVPRTRNLGRAPVWNHAPVHLGGLHHPHHTSHELPHLRRVVAFYGFTHMFRHHRTVCVTLLFAFTESFFASTSFATRFASVIHPSSSIGAVIPPFCSKSQM